MTDALTQIDLDALQQAILDAIAAQFPDLVTVEGYREDRTKIPTPACLVELVDLEAEEGQDLGTEQLPMRANFSARLVISFKTPAAEREIRKMAAALAVFASGNRWGMPASPAVVTAAGPDDFAPGLDKFVIWSVEWSQVVHLGASVWTNDGTVPQALYSFAPYIGPENEPAYQPLEDAAP